ncbi:hypothetical protein MMC29_001572 [Sticta canariensis]|nr:hypothetical protein [Sticta canariensis]
MRNFLPLVLFAECSTSLIVRQIGDPFADASDSLVRTTNTAFGSFDLSTGAAQSPSLTPEITDPTSYENELALASPNSDNSLMSHLTDTDISASTNPPSYLIAGAAASPNLWETLGQAIAICYSIFAYYAHEIQALAQSQSSAQEPTRESQASTTYKTRWLSGLCPVEIYGYHTEPLCDLGFMHSKPDYVMGCPERTFVSHWCCDPIFAIEGETPDTSTAYDCEPWLGDFDIKNFGL